MTTPAPMPKNARCHPHPRRSRGRGVRGQGGFTLLEAAMAVTIIGVGVLAMVEAQTAFVRSNLWSSHAASGAYLGGEVRELMRGLPRHDPTRGLEGDPASFGPEPGEVTIDDYDDIDDFDGLIFGFEGNSDGPIDAVGRMIPGITVTGEDMLDELGNVTGMPGWSQEILVEKVEPFDTSIVRPDEYYRVPPGSDDIDAPLGGEGTSSPPLAVDEFPLRVTVIVRYAAGGVSEENQEISRVTWIVPRD